MLLYTTTNGCPLIPHLQSIAFPYHVDVYQYGYTYTYNKLETMAQISKTQRYISKSKQQKNSKTQSKSKHDRNIQTKQPTIQKNEI
jgi:hypothetical protein